jgi:coenzyme F420-0:L-glutamate ligase/coenzyme F420-1:gamma-L-glutamate ligase
LPKTDLSSRITDSTISGFGPLKSLIVYALEDFPLIKAGDDVGETIVKVCRGNGFSIENLDLIVVAQKIFSKAEKRVYRLKDVAASQEAKRLSKVTGRDPRFVELVLRETDTVLKASPEILLVRDRRGLVCINAGIDKSNVKGAENFALLPEDPDDSARKCRLTIEKLTGKRVAVIVCDTYSRPFRRGQVNFAIGVSGMDMFRDYRGKKDLFGHILKVKCVAKVDEIAAASELVMGQGAEGTPVVIIRGLGLYEDPRREPHLSELTISGEEDLFQGAV